MRKYIADVILIKNTSGGKSDETFHEQEIYFRREPDTLVTSVDGYTSAASHDTIIRWMGGEAKYFTPDVTNVKIVNSDGRVLVNGTLNRNFTVPSDEEGGFVTFAVLEGS